MIARLQGVLVRQTADFVVLDLNGVGYQVFVSQTSREQLGAIGQTVTLQIHTSVREDAIQLFGFYDPVEQDTFEALIAMNGVGPKLALTVLSGIDARELAVAVCSGDVARLCLIPGIGKKKAERMILDLKDRLLPLAQTQTSPTGTQSATLDDLRSALNNLGFKGAEVEQVIGMLREQALAGGELDVLLPEALRLLKG